MADSPREVAAAGERIILMLSDDAAVREVVSGDQGVLAGARAGSIVLE